MHSLLDFILQFNIWFILYIISSVILLFVCDVPNIFFQICEPHVFDNHLSKWMNYWSLYQFTFSTFTDKCVSIYVTVGVVY